jgi:hypothetical protein
MKIFSVCKAKLTTDFAEIRRAKTKLSAPAAAALTKRMGARSKFALPFIFGQGKSMVYTFP